MVGPFHGYLIAKIMQNILGPYGKLSAGRLYPLLTKLEEAGLIVVEPVSEQQEERLRLIEHYIGYCQSLVSYGTARAEELAQSGRDPKSPINMTSAQLADLLMGMH